MKLNCVMTTLVLAMVVMLYPSSPLLASNTVELSLENTLQLETAAVDVASSSDGSRIFVLTDQGQVIVYSSQGEIQGQLDVGPDVDQIKAAPKGDSILLNSRKNKTVQVVSLDFIQQIDATGSPFKGRPDAPVTVAVFTDFQ
jgi:hypothetical protein